VTFFDLERPSDFSRLEEAGEEDLGLLQREAGTVCIDEVQRAPGLLPVLRALLDDRTRKARCLLLGSASPGVIQGASESLAGRVGFLDLTPLLAAETGSGDGVRRRRHWTRGGFPRSVLARSEQGSMEWRESYIRTMVERDIPLLGLRLPPQTLLRLWTMLAHVHGGLLNHSELGAGLGVTGPTVGRYIDVLEGAYVVRRLPPFWANVGKRLAKALKVYVRDSGLLHGLLGIHSYDALRAHPKVGASWEGWVVEQILGALQLAGERVEPFFWRTHGGAEVDLILSFRGRVVPAEIKLGPEARPSRGLLECMSDLGVRSGFVIHGGVSAHPLGKGVWAIPASLVAEPERLSGALQSPRRALA
jgi:predicted AAA+ superfamily ATPase